MKAPRIALMLLLALLMPMSASAGELVIELPQSSVESVVSIHSLDRKARLKPLKKAVVLHQKDRMFEPHLTIIPAGSTVDMTNDDVVYHNVFSFSKAKTFDLGLYPYGDRKEVLFDKPGEVKIFCAVHPDMHAIILVMDTPWFKRVDGVRQVRFSKLPQGNYTIHLWRKKMAPLTLAKVTVAKTGRTTASLKAEEVDSQ